MKAYLLPGTLGLLLGILLHWTGFSRREGVRQALGLRRSYPLRSGLYAVGAAMAMTALLCWLAVIDVDLITVLPLSAGALAGGALLGIAAGLCGFTPVTAFAGLGAGRLPVALEALCALAGCFGTAFVLPQLTGLLTPLQQAAPYTYATVFRVTLDEPYLLDGSFLGQGCAGVLLLAIAMCIPGPVRHAVPVADSSPDAEMLPPAPEEAPVDTFVAVLPGEEPLVIDTAMDEEQEQQEGEEAADSQEPAEEEALPPLSLPEEPEAAAAPESLDLPEDEAGDDEPEEEEEEEPPQDSPEA